MKRAAIKASLGVHSRRAARADRKYRAAPVGSRSAKYWKRKREREIRIVARRLKQYLAALPLREKAADVLVGWAKAGVVEQGGNNRGREVEKIIRANGGVPGEPWCGDTVAAGYLKAGSKSVQRAWASVSALSRLLDRVGNPKRGHVVIYDFSHTGLFLRWIDRKAGTFKAVEGNTGTGGAVSDSSGGDGVHVRERHMSQVVGFRRVVR